MIRKPKQAVVVIHGMGEQHPMGTLRSLVEAVWEGDMELYENPARRNVWWIKPDKRAGLEELRRITTGKLNAPGSAADGKRTDFYEFYWADIMQGTTWQHLVSWVKGLLFRLPYRVPTNALQVWLALWTLTVLAALYAVTQFAGLNIWGFHPIGPFLACSDPYHFWGCGILQSLTAPFVALENAHSGLLFTITFAVVLGALVYRVVKRNQFTWKRTGSSIVVFFLLLALAYPILKGLVSHVGIFTVLIPLLAIRINSVFVKYFGDIARYVEASPANVEKRNQIRERGIELFRGLHECGDYDRIIVVSHSLGTIIAYDILGMLWSERGPKPSNGLSDITRNKMVAMDEWLHDVAFNAETKFSRSKYRTMQREIAAELAKGYRPDNSRSAKANDGTNGSNWLVTDFITLGSPLTHAEFLLAEDEAGIDQLVRERLMPVCPPALEYNPELQRGSFMYSTQGKQFPHHAAMFCAVRWTNIYDYHPIALFGDVISGKVSGNFGKGIQTVASPSKAMDLYPVEAIAECRVEIRNIPSNSRIFTHTTYWAWPQHKWTHEVPEYVQTLRNAVNLRDELPDRAGIVEEGAEIVAP